MKTALYIVIGVMLGLMATVYLLRVPHAPDSRNGEWYTSTKIGSTHADIFTRAVVAAQGLLAMNNSQTIYYATANDSEGRTLDGA